MADDINLDDYDIEADRDGELSLTHRHGFPHWCCDVPGDGWSIADLIRRAQAHHAEAHRPVVDGEVSDG